MSIDQLIRALSIEEFDGNEYSKSVLNTIRDRCSTLNEFSVNAEYFFKDPKDYDKKLIIKYCKKDTPEHLSILKKKFEELKNWEQIYIKEVMDKVVADFEIGFGKIGLPLRLALTATVNSPSIDLVCQLLGRDITLNRIEKFLNRIKGLKTDQ